MTTQSTDAINKPKKVNIHPEWYALLKEEFEKDYFAKLKSFLLAEKAKYKVFPPSNRIFAAFDHTPPQEVKVLIMGQDPYHGPGQACGFCFSVQEGVPHPPSLRNIYKEVSDNMNVPYPKSGDLTPWAEQGVFLLNATLTVRQGQAGSHQNKGWELFTDKVIEIISSQTERVIFMLWGNFAISKQKLIDKQKHHILTAPHPSPLSAHRGFFGCQHFSKANALLQQMGKTPIDWRIA